MKTRTRIVASLLTLGLAGLLVAAAIGELRQSQVALADARPAAAVSAAQVAQTLADFRQIAQDVTPGVVNISTRKTIKARSGRDPLREFFGGDLGGPEGGSRTQKSLGSGFVIDKSGLILTNRHVIDGADEIQVTLADGKTEYDAKLVGKDARTDVALLKIEPTAPLTVLPLGDSDKVEVAEWVMAVGAPFGLGSTVTVGVVSYKGRDLELGRQNTTVGTIQTDASINPGNSGGPLINARGQVIGINTLIFTQNGQSAGVGFAVAINAAQQILPQLREKGKVVRGYLGLTISTPNADMAKSLGLDQARGALVQDIDARGPALKAGIEPEDVVLEVDGRRIEESSDLSSYVASRPPGATVKLTVFRKRAEKSLTITLGTFPDDDEDRRASTDEERGSKLGMSLRDLTPALAERLQLPRDAKGVVIASVEAGEPAERAGLAHGDLIVSVNGAAISGVDEFERELERARPEGLARLRVRRGSAYSFLIIRLK